jgi:hypothetical protein
MLDKSSLCSLAVGVDGFHHPSSAVPGSEGKVRRRPMHFSSIHDKPNRFKKSLLQQKKKQRKKNQILFLLAFFVVRSSRLVLLFDRGGKNRPTSTVVPTQIDPI